MKKIDVELRKDLKCWRTKIRHGGGKEYMTQVYRDAISWCETAIEGVQRSAETAGSEFSRMSDRWGSGLPENAEPNVLYYPTLVSRAANVGGWFALILEGVIAGSMSVWLFNLPAFLAFVIGVCVCVATAVFIKGLCAPILLARADAHPKQAAHWLLLSLLILTPIELGLLTVAFLVRGATGDFGDLIGWVFTVVIGVLSVSTPILAALLFTAAGLFGWSRQLAAEYDGARHLKREIEALKSVCERQLADHALHVDTQESPTVAIRLKPNVVEGGQAVTGEVQLVNDAPEGGAEVILTCDHMGVQIPFSVAVAPHSRIVSFAGTTPRVTDPVIALISARIGNSITTAKLVISPRNGNRIGFGIPAIMLAVVLGAASQGQAQQLARIWTDRTSSCVREDLRRALAETGIQLPDISCPFGKPA